MSKIEYFENNGGYAAIDRKQVDATGCFVFGRGPLLNGDITTVRDVCFETRKLPAPIPAFLVPPEWQEALGLAPVVEAIKLAPYVPGTVPSYEAPVHDWVWPMMLPRSEEGDNPLVGAILSVVCVVIIVFLHWFT